MTPNGVDFSFLSNQGALQTLVVISTSCCVAGSSVAVADSLGSPLVCA